MTPTPSGPLRVCGNVERPDFNRTLKGYARCSPLAAGSFEKIDVRFPGQISIDPWDRLAI